MGKQRQIEQLMQLLEGEQQREKTKQSKKAGTNNHDI